MNGLRWPIATDGQRIQIGCQLHTVGEWQGFTDAEICNMASGALELWRAYKPAIMQLAQTRKGEMKMRTDYEQQAQDFLDATGTA